MKNKIWGWVLLILIIVIAIIFISKDSKKPIESDPVRIGVIAPFTGNFAVFGERIKNGFELAKEDIIASGDAQTINILYEDACQPQTAVTAVQKLIDFDKIDILGGSFCVVGFVPVISILEQHQILTFNTAPNPDDASNKKYVVSTNSGIREKATRLGEFAFDELEAKTAAVIYYNTPLGKDYEKYFKSTFEEKGGKIISSEVTLVDATDFRTQLTKIKSQNVDVIFVVQLASPLGNLLKQANELGIEATILGNPSNEDPTIITTAGSAAEGFVISSDEPIPKTDKILDFEKRYEERFGQKADVYAANAYDALHLQVVVFNECGRDVECMLKEIHDVQDYSGVSGNITIEADGSASKPNTFKVVKDGKFVKYE